MGHQINSIWAIRSKLHQTCFQQCFLGQMQVKTPALVAVINQMPVHTYCASFESPVLTGYSCENFHPEPLEAMHL